jgi:hypothetical protein
MLCGAKRLAFDSLRSLKDPPSIKEGRDRKNQFFPSFISYYAG